MISSLNLQPSRPAAGKNHHARLAPPSFPPPPPHHVFTKTPPYQQQRRALSHDSHQQDASNSSFFNIERLEDNSLSKQQQPTSQIDAMPPHLSPPAARAPFAPTIAITQRQASPLLYNAATCHPVFFSGRWHRPPQFHAAAATAASIREMSISPVAEGYVWARERSNSAVGGQGPKL